MKRFCQRFIGLFVCAVLLVMSFSAPVAYAASDVYELAFDNLFVFEQWANNVNSGALPSGSEGELTKDIAAGSFTLTNNSSTTEIYTDHSMDSIGGYYYMEAEPNTEYTLAFDVVGSTVSFESFAFFFDSTGTYISYLNRFATNYNLNEWQFVTPEGTEYIQLRFDNNSPSSYATVSQIRFCEASVYEYSKNNTFRKSFTYSAETVYGALPVPERDGLVFAGWYTGPDGTGERITSDTVMTASSYCLFSKWDPILVGELEIVSLPFKQTYCLGEKVNTKGLVIGVTYPDGTRENIDEGFSCSPETLTATGTQIVTVNYGSGSVDFEVTVKESETVNLTVNNTEYQVTVANNKYTLNYTGSEFNRYEINYSSDAYVKGEMNFDGVVEEFFLEPADNGSFSSYIDGFLSGTTQSEVTSISFEPLDKEFLDFTLSCVDLSMATDSGDSDGMVYLDGTNYKIGIDLDWGGALTYMEDKVNSVMSSVSKYSSSKVTEVDFKSKVSTSFFYNTSSSVNLINCHDTGRLVQQSYYGTGDSSYVPGMYQGVAWSYNPVQGGNLYNEASKIVDFKVTDNEIYIKCRPLDWAREAIYITPSYMEAWYTLDGSLMRATCRFVDYSGYPSVKTTQELPAFYCVEPLNDFVYYTGGEPWSDSNTKTTLTDLGFWGTATDQNFHCNENWAAFKGDDDDSFGIGLYCPGQTNFYSGIFDCDNGTRASTVSPSTENPTSYIGVVDSLCFQSYKPISYCYYITTGNTDTIRSTFKPLAQESEDICNATYTNGFCDMCGKYKAPELTTDIYDLDGDGAFENVYEISNAGELHWFRDNVNGGDVNANAVLVCDITDNADVLAEYGVLNDDVSLFRKWSAIGTQANKYNGYFNGQEHTVNGLYADSSTAFCEGLFGYTDSDAVIEKTGVDDSYFCANQYTGGVCGYNNGSIMNCYSFYTVTISNDKYAGGITGYNNGSVENCYGTGVVKADTYAGGITGDKASVFDISNCYYLSGCATDGSGLAQNGTGASVSGSVTEDSVGDAQGKTVEEFASGEIAYLLQKANSEQLWGQKTNLSGYAPVFDTSGEYRVKAVEGTINYTLVNIGDIDNDDVVDVSDYQQLVNKALSDESLEYKDMHISDIDGDGAVDVLDCSRMELMVNGHPEKPQVYLKGDYDFDGIPFTQEDIYAIKKGIVNLDKLNTVQKYACDLNFDGVIDYKDKDILNDL